MATPVTDEDHDMDDQSDVEDESRIDGHDETQLNGQHETVHESSTPTNYSLFDIHPQLGKLRQQLHDLDTPIELPRVDFEAVIPYMDNVWRKLKSSEQTQAADNTELYWCKLRKHPGAKPHTPRPTPEGKQARKRKPKEEKACNMSMKVIYSHGPEKVTIMKSAEGETHTHDLDLMDQQKRNTGVMDTARREAVRGFQPASIWWKMQQEPDKLEAAGGKFMKISDVRNVQYPWRQENPDVPLKAHTGYNSARTGPKPGQQNLRTKPSPSQTPAQPAVPNNPPPPPQQEPHAPPYHQQHPPVPQPAHGPAAPADEILHYPLEQRHFLGPYLPDQAAIAARNRPHVTLTWAQGLDGRIASSPGYRTALSGPETKSMTHFLRSTHDAILVGVRTAIADDPGLNCRLSGAGGYGGPGQRWQPRPIIIDPSGRLIIRPEMKILQVANRGWAKAPWIIVGPNVNLHPVAVSTLKSHGGEYLMINDVDQYGRIGWEGIFQVLFRENIKSIMIEGGGLVLSELLSRRYLPSIDSVITTVVPTFLGKGGVEVSPHTEYDSNRMILQNRLQQVRWQPIGAAGEVIMCGKLEQPHVQGNGILHGIVEMANADGSHDQHRPPQHQQQQPQQQHGPPQGPPQHHNQWPPPGQHGHPPPHAPHYQGHPPQGPPPPQGASHQGQPPPGQPQHGPPPPQQGAPQQQGPPPPQGSPNQQRSSQPPPPQHHQQQHPYHPPPPASASPRHGGAPPKR
jgi:2,5-diamino-6-(ribosylamino)-4(3H)-pyrimidinone 5'-phosphate reductase